MAQKLDRKELKKPDEFQVVAGKVMGWIAAHQKPVLAGLIALAVLLLGGWAASAYSTSRVVSLPKQSPISPKHTISTPMIRPI